MRDVDNFKIFTIIFLLFTLVSCDPGIQVTYQVKNGADKKIKIIYVIAGVGNLDTTETGLSINQISILKIEDVLGKPKSYDTKQDSIITFRYLSIRKDILVSPKNFRDKKEWDYNKTGKHSATYELLIDNTDF